MAFSLDTNSYFTIDFEWFLFSFLYDKGSFVFGPIVRLHNMHGWSVVSTTKYFLDRTSSRSQNQPYVHGTYSTE
jgi:hypothetical protein